MSASGQLLGIVGRMLASAWITDIQWVLVILIGVVAATALLSLSVHPGLALAHDALPYLLGLAWVIMIAALIGGAWILAATAGVLVLYHLTLIIPRYLSDRKPRWAATAPKFRLVVSNVFTENPTPQLLAEQLLSADGDVMIITEWNQTFAAAFEAAGGNRTHPHMLVDKDDHSEYNVAIASKLPLNDASRIHEVGKLKLTHAVVTCGDTLVQVIGMIQYAIVDPGGFAIWKAQVNELIDHLPTVDVPVLLAGDFNTTRFRPEFKGLLKTGFVDAHDSLGRGLSSSFRLSNEGVLASPGAVVRLDHALLSNGLTAVEVSDLEACGSDHLPFALTIAVRQAKRSSASVNKGVRQPVVGRRSSPTTTKSGQDPPESVAS